MRLGLDLVVLSCRVKPGEAHQVIRWKRSIDRFADFGLTFRQSRLHLFHLHFTPTSSSWLNQIERWFAYRTEH
ncbi:MAG: hypothetical protein K0S98_2697 [Propionibacteriaceae bacterium]|jgi:hypothetical protein|nr:hypothetical protein [Propionibacteriaceae bacterium]